MGLAAEHSAEQWIAAVTGAAVFPLLYFQQTSLVLPLMAGTFLLLALLFLFRLSDLSVDLLDGVEGVDRDNNASGGQNSIVGYDKLGDVGKEEAHPVSFLHAVPFQGGS